MKCFYKTQTLFIVLVTEIFSHLYQFSSDLFSYSRDSVFKRRVSVLCFV